MIIQQVELAVFDNGTTKVLTELNLDAVDVMLHMDNSRLYLKDKLGTKTYAVFNFHDDIWSVY